MNVAPLVSDSLGNSVKFIFRSENNMLSHRRAPAISLAAAMISGVIEKLMQESEIWGLPCPNLRDGEAAAKQVEWN